QRGALRRLDRRRRGAGCQQNRRQGQRPCAQGSTYEEHAQFPLDREGMATGAVPGLTGALLDDGAAGLPPPNRLCQKPQPSTSPDSEPVTTGTCFAPEHCCSVGLPSAGLTHAICNPSPGAADSGRVGSLANRLRHTRSAPVAPNRWAGLLSSRPIQNTPRCSPVKPANQLSRKSLLVPVLPATCSEARLELPSELAVP